MLFSGSFYQTPVSNSDPSGLHCGSVRTVLYGLARRERGASETKWIQSTSLFSVGFKSTLPAYLGHEK